MSSEQFEKLMESQKFRKGNKKTKYDLSELGQVQLDPIDEFNMFKNPHGLETLTEEDSLQLRELYGVRLFSNFIGQEIFTVRCSFRAKFEWI